MSTDQDRATPSARRTFTRVGLGVAALGVSAAATVAIAGVLAGHPAQEKQLLAALAKNLPSATVSGVDCSVAAAPKGLCEFVSGPNVFYATPDGRFVVIGRVLDLQKQVDLTERRTREVGAVATAEDQISGQVSLAAAERGSAPAAGPARAAPPQVLKVDLPIENAVVHNPGGRLKMTVFTDFNCHFCRQLFEDLRGNRDIEVTEYPIAFLSPDSATKAKSVLCASNRQAVSEALYGGGAPAAPIDCLEGARRLQQNLAFAQAHGITGTPMIVRADGATNPGWMPTEQLVAWLRASRT
jgi:thiol:disulfide interchange protein DsbC